jgi:hypothetical protein
MSKYLLGLVAGTALAFSATAASAATTFAGGAQGCFVAPGPGSCATASSATDNGLTFTGGTATFSQNTDATGFAAIGGPTNNFGTITLAPSGHSYSSDLFDLLITFTLPVGSGTGSFTANLLGSLTSFGSGGVQITFQNPDQLIASPGGNFTLHVNNVSFSGSPLAGETVLRQDISGYIQAVPEPGTWALMLIGFGGIGLAMRRRRRPALAQIA